MNYQNFAFFTFLSLNSYCAFAALLTTSERLGAGGGYDTVHAGYYRSFSHCTFRGATPPLAPNRQLCAGIFLSKFISSLFVSNKYYAVSLLPNFFYVGKSYFRKHFLLVRYGAGCIITILFVVSYALFFF